MSLRILILGAGGREHALAWKLAKSPRVERIFVCPGNGGTSTESKTVNVSLPADDFPALVDFAVKEQVIFTCYATVLISDIYIYC